VEVEDYADKITAERVRRVITGVPSRIKEVCNICKTENRQVRLLGWAP